MESSQQTYVGLENLSRKPLQHIFNVTSFRLPRRRGRRKIVAMKTSSRHLEDMSGRRLEGIS